MPVPHLRLSVPYLSIINQVSTNLLSWPFGFVVECPQYQPNYRVSFVKNIYPSLGPISSSRGLSDVRVCHVSIDTAVDRTSTEEIQFNGYPHSAISLSPEDYKETERRRKIGLANKGKTPWNKGKAHSAETREVIRRRTKEALSDPKIRKKMSESPRNHSDQTKARIRASLRRLWGGRLKSKRPREKFLQSWAQSISNAAKKGGSDQEELEWDSYDKIKKDIALQQLQWAVEKAKAKEITRLRVLRASETKAAKMAAVAQKRKEREEEAKLRGEVKGKKMTPRKSKEEKEEFAVARELELKEKLTKIHKKIRINGEFSNKDNRAWEKLELKLVRNDGMAKEISLADQILAAKQKRAGIVSMKERLTYDLA